MASAAVRALAPAKLNWTLEVLRRRDDGYHELATVLQTLALADTVTVAPARGLSLAVEGAYAGRTGPPQGNLAWSAALQLRATYGVTEGAAIIIEKHVPVAAGLGGGSSDAVATLRALASLWRLDIDHEGLRTLAAGLGSDPPFFVYGGTALAEGRGERISPLPDAPAVELLLLPAPPADDERKTARLFGLLTPAAFTDGSRTRNLAEALRAGTVAGAAGVDAAYVNAFECVADAAFAGQAGRRAALLAATSGTPRLAGAGPTLYAVAGSGDGPVPPGAIRTRTLTRDEACALAAADG